MRKTLLLFCLLLAPVTGFAASPGDGFCGLMQMPPEQLSYVSRGFSRFHSGVDLMAPYGSPIRAAAAGTVVYAGWYFAYGKIVDIRHTDGVITRYAHMSAFAPGLGSGMQVAAGEVIGQVGMTGRAHGAHVHFEVRIDGRAVDPKPYLALAPCTDVAPRDAIEEASAPEPRHKRQ
jgi:murein DD-endopeptidase MepM/ murein hydrolase activator NlpD